MPPLGCYAAHFFKKQGMIFQYLQRMPGSLRQCGKIRLRRRGKHHCAAVFFAQRIYSRHRRCRQGRGQTLRLIKEHHAVCNMMQLPASSWVCRKQAFKESNGCGNDYRAIPSKSQLPGLFRQIPLAVINQNFRENFPVFQLRLLCQCQERQHHNDSVQSMLHTVTEGKMKHRHRLANTGRRCQSKQARGQLACFPATVVNLVAQSVNSAVSLGILAQLGAVLL